MEQQREKIVNALVKLYEPSDDVYAVWENGSTAFNRVDDYSDIDLAVECETNAIPSLIEKAEKILEEVVGIEYRYEMKQNFFQGMTQIFYKFKNTSPFLLLDIGFLHHGETKDNLTQPEIHGDVKVHFDKIGMTENKELEKGEWDKKMAERIAAHRERFQVFDILPLKELYRKQYVDTFAFYMGHYINPLVELLRIKYKPFRYNFGLRYLSYDLPEEEFKLIEQLVFVKDGTDMEKKAMIAKKKIQELLDELSQ
ncbi:MAG: nucleotidyltransferase domain-containing protein [Bacteroidetes bacterium]|nr:nucleotidyltransferase domain-containing protein [Bacteroidota bacterium]